MVEQDDSNEVNTTDGEHDPEQPGGAGQDDESRDGLWDGVLDASDEGEDDGRDLWAERRDRVESIRNRMRRIPARHDGETPAASAARTDADGESTDAEGREPAEEAGLNPLLAAFEERLENPDVLRRAPASTPDGEAEEPGGVAAEIPRTGSLFAGLTDLDDEEEDPVGQAFLAHADGDEAEDTEDEVLGGLLGDVADDMSEDDDEEEPPFQPLGREWSSRAFAPQRSATVAAATSAWTTEARSDDDWDEWDDEGAYKDYELEEEEEEERARVQAEADAAAARAEARSAARRRRVRSVVRDVVEMTLLGVLVFLAVKASVHRYRVEGESMFPTIEDGQQFLVNKLAYSEVDLDKVPFIEGGDDPTRDVFGGPGRGDVIVFHDPRGSNQDLIKRIIGVPGDTIEIEQGTVFVNGNELIEPYIVSQWSGSISPIEVPEGHYFVMGDNRGNSTDSRVFGAIERELIVGKTLVGLWPVDNIGLGPSESPQCVEVPSCAPVDSPGAVAVP